MADKKFSMDDYVDVAERVQDFADAYPNDPTGAFGASFGKPEWGVIEVAGQTFVHCTVAAHRSESDATPGYGIAWEPFPGRTSFTKDSELMNAHTAAMGRAVIALGLTANRKLASRQEVRNRVEDQRADAAEAAKTPAEKAATKPAKAKPAAVPKLTDAERQELGSLYVASGWAQAELCLQLVLVDALPSAAVDALGDHPTDDQYAGLIGPAMGALNPEQFATVKAALSAEAAKVAAATA